LTSTAV